MPDLAEKAKAVAAAASPFARYSLDGGVVRFGMPRNRPLNMVKLQPDDFAEMPFADAVARLRREWNL